jgi:hypothetical protein
MTLAADFGLEAAEMDARGYFKPQPVRESVLATDIGSLHDHSTLLWIESVSGDPVSPPVMLEDLHYKTRPTRYEIHAAIKFGLGVDYTALAMALRAIKARPGLPASAPLVIDSSGVGEGVRHMLRRLNVNPLIGVTVTAGQGASKVSPGKWHVSKSVLVTKLMGVIGSREWVIGPDGKRREQSFLQIPTDLAEGQTLRDELAAFSVNFTKSGAMTYAAEGSGHDDFVSALSLGIYYLSNHGTLTAIPFGDPRAPL